MSSLDTIVATSQEDEELNEAIYGRTDTDKYKESCECRV